MQTDVPFLEFYFIGTPAFPLHAALRPRPENLKPYQGDQREFVALRLVRNGRRKGDETYDNGNICIEMAFQLLIDVLPYWFRLSVSIWP